MTSIQHVRVEGTGYQRGLRLQRLLAAGTARTLDDFGALLADHADYPHSICAHPDPRLLEPPLS